MTWSRVVTVVVVSYLVASVVAVADLEDNVVPEDSLQDLTVRTKKSPAESHEKTPSEPESKSDSQLKAALTEDIKRKIEDLMELKNAYRKVEEDFFGSESQTLKSSVEKSSSERLASETKTLLQAGSAAPDDESVRIARQYFPSSYSDSKEKYDSKKGTYPENSYSNGKYQSLSSHPMDSFGDRDAPYIAQYNPSSRTFGEFKLDPHKIPHIKPELSIHIPTISINSVELGPGGPPTEPIHTEPSPINVVLPASLPTVTVSDKPHEGAGHTKKPETNVPLYYEKKEIGTPGSFFSKQIMYGPSKDFGDGNYYSPYYSYPQGETYLQPGYSSYPHGHSYGGSPSYWYAADKGGYSSPGYSLYPDVQANYNYGPVYSPGYSYQSYNKPPGAYRSSRDLSDQFQRYQDELDSLLSQFFRMDSAGGAANSTAFGNHYTVGQLTEAIEQEEKKIQALQDELKTNPGSNEGSGISQSFVNWLSGEIDAVYSRWTHLKDDITKTKPDSVVSAKEDLKVENVKV